MIYVGLGANLVHPIHGGPANTLKIVRKSLDSGQIKVLRMSGLYETGPVPVSDDPWFVNAVLSIETNLSPYDLLQILHKTENVFGRERSAINAPRVIDLDLLAYHDIVSPPGEIPILPHPRLDQRIFVMKPLSELDPGWIHPRTGAVVRDIMGGIPSNQKCRRLKYF